MPVIARKNRARVAGLPVQGRLLVALGKLYFSMAVGEFDDIIIVIKCTRSRVISCGRRDCADFVFMFELEVVVEIFFINIIVVHDLGEFFKLFGEVIIITRFLKF